MAKVLLNSTSVAAAPADPGAPAAPTEYTYPAAPANWAALTSGKTVHTPANNSELQTLLGPGDIGHGTLAAGDIIALDAGVTYSGRFVLPDLGDTDWTWLVSDEYDNLPAEGTRVKSTDTANLAKFEATDSGNAYLAAIHTAFNARKWRMCGLELTVDTTNTVTGFGVIRTGYDGDGGAEADSSELPEDIVIERCWMYGRDDVQYNDRECIYANANGMAVVDCTIEKFSNASTESTECIGIRNSFPSDGYLIQNNHISVAGINVLFGGTGVSASWPTPRWAHNIVIRGNHLSKQEKWFPDAVSYDGHLRWIKNLLEFKRAEKALVVGNILEDVGYELGGQRRSALVLTVRSQTDWSTEATVQDIEIKHNIIRRSGGQIRLSGQDDLEDSEPLRRVWVHDNLFDQHNYHPGAQGPWGQVYLAGSLRNTSYTTTMEDVRIISNTMVIGPGGTANQYGEILDVEGLASNGMTGFIWQDNIEEAYGVNDRPVCWDSSPANGDWGTCLNRITTGGYTYTGNVVFDETAHNQSNYYPVSGQDFDTKANMNFTDYDNQDYTISTSSYIGKGADIAAINTATANVISGDTN